MRRLPLRSPPRMRGKVIVSEPKCRSNWDHPRVCGEKSARILKRRTEKRDHPPRVRGKAEVRHERDQRTRDHPRVCGEKALSSFSSPEKLGITPAASAGGKVQPDAVGCRPPRITPAYAGKRMLYARAARRDRGSHPRMRGIRQRSRHRLHLANGITPADAGKRMLYA